MRWETCRQEKKMPKKVFLKVFLFTTSRYIFTYLNHRHLFSTLLCCFCGRSVGFWNCGTRTTFGTGAPSGGSYCNMIRSAVIKYSCYIYILTSAEVKAERTIFINTLDTKIYLILTPVCSAGPRSKPRHPAAAPRVETTFAFNPLV